MDSSETPSALQLSSFAAARRAIELRRAATAPNRSAASAANEDSFLRTEGAATGATTGAGGCFPGGEPRIAATAAAAAASPSNAPRPRSRITQEQVIVGHFCRHALSCLVRLSAGRPDTQQLQDNLKASIKQLWARWVVNQITKAFLLESIARDVRTSCPNASRVNVITEFRNWYHQQLRAQRSNRRARGTPVAAAAPTPTSRQQTDAHNLPLPLPAPPLPDDPPLPVLLAKLGCVCADVTKLKQRLHIAPSEIKSLYEQLENVWSQVHLRVGNIRKEALELHDNLPSAVQPQPNPTRSQVEACKLPVKRGPPPADDEKLSKCARPNKEE